MTKQTFDMNAYLDRINYTGGGDVSYETLRDLHYAHTLNVPFENLDIKKGKEISIKIEDIFQKIVIDRKGGYCFEMNGLFSFVLKELGFNVKNLMARVILPNSDQAIKTHHTMLVEIDGQQWLADVGFGGDGLFGPIRFELDVEQQHFSKIHRVIRHPLYGYGLQYKDGYEFTDIYAFTLQDVYPEDYEVANYFTSTHPSSFFKTTILCTKQTLEGRITLFNNRLKLVSKNQVTEITLADEVEIKEAINSHFGIHLD